jgi:hypothetical protein
LDRLVAEDLPGSPSQDLIVAPDPALKGSL